MNKRLLWLILIFSSTLVFADTDSEIKHLLDFVETTDCRYQRNGTDYNGAEAREHIQKKFDYYRNKIKTTEDFIDYSATKSMMSGKRYRIICTDKDVQFSNDWLNQELSVFRSRVTDK